MRMDELEPGDDKEGGGKEARNQERKNGKIREERVVDNVTRLGDK